MRKENTMTVAASAMPSVAMMVNASVGARLSDTARMQEIVKAFLETGTGEERHAARVRKILDLEKKYMKSSS